jgi:hypothetical protein
MDVANWILSQSITTKLLLGLSCGIVIYILFRWFIYSANKAYQESNPKKATETDRLKNLFGR